MQDAEVTQALIDHLQGKKFIALSKFQKSKFSKAFHNKVGFNSDSSVAKVAESIKPYLSNDLTIIIKGNSNYLAFKQSRQERITGFIETHQGCSPGVAVNALNLLSKADIIKELNAMVVFGEIRIEITDKYSVKLFTIEKKASTPGRAPVTTHTPPPESQNDRVLFKEAFDALDRGRIFVRIFEVRRKLNWPCEKFDTMLVKLRDEAVIQLHAGDNTSMKKDEIQDSFIDDNGFLHITMTWRKR